MCGQQLQPPPAACGTGINSSSGTHLCLGAGHASAARLGAMLTRAEEAHGSCVLRLLLLLLPASRDDFRCSCCCACCCARSLLCCCRPLAAG